MIFFSSFQSVNKRVVGLINVLFLQGSLFAISRIEILKKKKIKFNLFFNLAFL